MNCPRMYECESFEIKIKNLRLWTGSTELLDVIELMALLIHDMSVHFARSAAHRNPLLQT